MSHFAARPNAGLRARFLAPFAAMWRHLQRSKAEPLHIAIVVSVLLHGALLLEWHFRPPIDKDRESKLGDTPGKFTVQLVPLPAAPAPAPSPPAAAAVATPPPEPAKSAPKPAPKPPPKPQAKPEQAAPPPVIALNKPGPEIASPAPAVSAAPAATPQNDLSALLEARRRARGESQQPAPAQASNPEAEGDIARRDRIVAANLGAKTEAFGFDQRNGGGVFQIDSLNADYAEFRFYGWRRDIGRRAAQVFEVRKGNHADIRLAVVRRMIAIIREHESGKFSWQSQRLGHSLMLSAAPADNAGLEAFFLLEFFAGGQIRRN